VRGGPAFAISLVLSAIEPTLRQLAELGAWQVSRRKPRVLDLLAHCGCSVASKHGCLLPSAS
jgi:hypothetical protein